MLRPFDGSAAWYDALYADKDYAGEAAHAVDLLRAQGLPPRGTILDAGCGTGRHAIEFRRLGHPVIGVDRSPAMLSLARERVAHGPAGGITLEQGDLLSLPRFSGVDAAVSLFHVLCYLAGPGELAMGLRSIRGSLPRGGGLVFDAWNREAVLKEGCTPRSRTVRNGSMEIRRQATPSEPTATGAIDVRFLYSVSESPGGALHTLEEVHRMLPHDRHSIAEALAAAGFGLVSYTAWGSSAPPTDADWNTCVVAVAT